MEGELAMAGISRAYKRRGNMVAMTGGPVLCLDAGSKISYPGSGTTWTDLSGNGNTGTLVNGPTFNSANGGSIVFDGVNDMVECQPSSLFNFGTNNFSAFVWFRFSQMVTYPTLLELDNSSSGNGIVFYGNVTGDPRFRTWIGGAVRNSTAGFAVNTWYHCGVSRSSGLVSQYINGVLDGTFTGSGNMPSGQFLRVGSLFYAGFNGRHAGATLYNRALSAAEITTNFELTRGRFGI